MARQLRGDTADVLHNLLGRPEVRNSADVAAVRKGLRSLRAAGLNDVAIAEALGPHAGRLRIGRAGGRLAVRGFDGAEVLADAARTPSLREMNPVDLAKHLGKEVCADLSGLQVDSRKMRFRADRYGAATAQTATLNHHWQSADVAGRARLMARVPAITQGALAVAPHGGDVHTMQSYGVAKRVEEVTRIWASPPPAAASNGKSGWENRWRFAAADSLPSSTFTLETKEGADGSIPLLSVWQMMAKGVEPLQVRIDGQLVAACRGAQLLCRRVLAMDPAFAEVLEEGVSDEGALWGDALEFAREEFARDTPELLAPVATAVVGMQQLVLNDR